jgi:hypothetical protein
MERSKNLNAQLHVLSSPHLDNMDANKYEAFAAQYITENPGAAHGQIFQAYFDKQTQGKQAMNTRLLGG